jgi:hypothetical protein
VVHNQLVLLYVLYCTDHTCCHSITHAHSLQGVSVPPWRRYDAMLARWLPKASTDEQVTQHHLAAAAQGSWPAPPAHTNSSTFAAHGAGGVTGCDVTSSSSSSSSSSGGVEGQRVVNSAGGVRGVAAGQHEPRVVYGFDIPANQQQQQQVVPSCAPSSSASSDGASVPVAVSLAATGVEQHRAKQSRVGSDVVGGDSAGGSDAGCTSEPPSEVSDGGDDSTEADDSTDEADSEPAAAAAAAELAPAAAQASAPKQDPFVAAIAAAVASGGAQGGRVSAAVSAAEREADAWIEGYRKVTKPPGSSSSSGADGKGGDSRSATGAAGLTAHLGGSTAAAGAGSIEDQPSAADDDDQGVCAGRPPVAAVAAQVWPASAGRSQVCTPTTAVSSSSTAGAAAGSAAGPTTPSVLRFTATKQVVRHGGGLSQPSGMTDSSSSIGSIGSGRICVVKLSGAAAAAAVHAQKQHQAAASHKAATVAVAPGVSSAELQAAFVGQLRLRMSGWEVGGGGSAGVPQCGGSLQHVSGAGSSGGCGGDSASSGGCGGAQQSFGVMSVAGGVSGGLASELGVGRVCRQLLSSSMAWPLGFG